MTEDLSGVSAVIDQNMAAFDKPGVLSVRPGYKVKNDWLTSTRSIVVTVRHKVRAPAGGRDAAGRGGRGAGGRAAGIPGQGPGAGGSAEVRGRAAAGAEPGVGAALPRRADAGGRPSGGGRVGARPAGGRGQARAHLRRPARRDPRSGRGAGDHHAQRQPGHRLADAEGLPGRHDADAHRRPVRLHLGARPAGGHGEPGRQAAEPGARPPGEEPDRGPDRRRHRQPAAAGPRARTSPRRGR